MGEILTSPLATRPTATLAVAADHLLAAHLHPRRPDTSVPAGRRHRRNTVVHVNIAECAIILMLFIVVLSWLLSIEKRKVPPKMRA